MHSISVKKNHIIIALGVLISAGVAALVFGMPGNGGTDAFASHSTAEGSPDLDTFQAEWVPHINNVGAKKAYADFLSAYSEEAPGQQHLFAHAFGQALYKTTQLAGISVCDRNYSFGCFHEFLGYAIHNEGLSVVSHLNEQCIEVLADQALGCQHGIGHGVTAYLGYEYEALVEALDVCSNLPVSDPIGGCYGGVFMEYNLQTVLGVEAEVRPFAEAKGVHYPCTSLDAAYQNACYFWQPQWWQSAFWETMEQNELYAQMGTWCEAAEMQEYRYQCYRGIGNNAPGRAGWKVSDMVAVCDAMPTERGNLLCRAGAYGAFFAAPDIKGNAPDLCVDGLTASQAQRCSNLANIPE